MDRGTYLALQSHAAGKSFGDFLVSPAAQKVIGTFGVDKYGQPLFFPAADKREDELVGADD